MTVRVLLADDHTVLRDSLHLLLDSVPNLAVVGGAANGVDAVREAKRLAPDVVVMDIGMPELNGIEATRLIREGCPKTRVLILSVYATSEHIFNALDAGAVGYLLKESAGKEVVEAVQTVHRGQYYFCRKIGMTVVEDYLRHGREPRKKSPLESLSPRERQILQLVVEGKSSSEVGEIVCLSCKTVETYRCRLMRKLGINDVPGLVKFAILHGLTSLV
jgi:two-component system, NarL family, response regulator NreC